MLQNYHFYLRTWNFHNFEFFWNFQFSDTIWDFRTVCDQLSLYRCLNLQAHFPTKDGRLNTQSSQLCSAKKWPRKIKFKVWKILNFVAFHFGHHCFVIVYGQLLVGFVQVRLFYAGWRFLLCFDGKTGLFGLSDLNDLCDLYDLKFQSLVYVVFS